MMTRVISFNLIIAAISLAVHNNGGDLELPNFELIVTNASRPLATPQPELCRQSTVDTTVTA